MDHQNASAVAAPRSWSEQEISDLVDYCSESGGYYADIYVDLATYLATKHVGEKRDPAEIPWMIRYVRIA